MKRLIFLTLVLVYFSFQAVGYSAKPEPLQEVVLDAQKSVVTIQVGRTYDSYEWDPGFIGKWFEGFFEKRRDEAEATRITCQAEGSGVVIDGSGLILTNAHVVSHSDVIKASFNDKKTLPVKLIGINYKDDLALLQVEANQTLKPIPLGNSDNTKQGDEVVAIGNPYGYQFTVTKGIISGKDRQVERSYRTFVNDLIQLDMNLNPGNSGGPLVNSKGEMVGLVSMGEPFAQGIGFAIPINKIKKAIPELHLGLERNKQLDTFFKKFDFSPQESKFKEGFGQVAVQEVSNRSIGERTGLRKGDVIYQFRNKYVSNLENLLEIASQIKPGERIYIELGRDGRRFFTYLEAK